MNLNQLADACEQATPEQQRELLERAFDAVFPLTSAGHWLSPSVPSPYFVRHLRFRRMLDAEAYESAAMMFVPEEYRDNFAFSSGSVFLGLDQFDPWSSDYSGGGETFALALLAASLRARG